jgi:hypothetical protein
MSSRTLHDRHLAREKERKRREDPRVQAAKDRDKANTLLGQAEYQLAQAEKKLAEAEMIASGWVCDTAVPYLAVLGNRSRAERLRDPWVPIVSETWTHKPTGAQVSRTYGMNGVIWLWREKSGMLFSQASDRFEAMEQVWLAATDLGKYPESPKKTLFDLVLQDV